MALIVRQKLIGWSASRIVSIVVATCLVALLCLSHARVSAQDESAQDESLQESAAIALYADAANFQTNGAIDLAIDNWKKFLAAHPNHKLAANASHYLGVCFMQQDPPNLKAAADAFEVALKDRQYELREESLSNRGWCLYAAGSGDDIDQSMLRESIQTHDKMLKEFPASQLRDRALFHRAESHYLLGDLDAAVESYNEMLQLDNISGSPLRCDALYARGVTLEEQKQFAKATSSYEQLLNACASSDLVADVQIRLGDLGIRQNDWKQAVGRFEAVVKSNSATDEDKAYAYFRQGFANAQLKQPKDASAAYENLLRQFPQSPYAAAATLASAQTLYQAGDTTAAATRFRDVLNGTDPVAATEAAHWLTRIELAVASAAKSNGDAAKANAAAEAAHEIASQKIKGGPQGNFAVALQLDAAEALSLLPDKLTEALDNYHRIAIENADHPLAPRALYNAAFIALQADQPAEAVTLAKQFEDRYRDDALAPDAAFVAAEALMASGQHKASAQRYQTLLDNVKYQDNSERPVWVLRGALAWILAAQPERVPALIRANLDSMKDPDQKAEALLLAGQAELASGDAVKAAEAFQASRAASPEWARSDEAFLLAGQSQFAAGNVEAASGIWYELIRENGDSRMADQARYKLGQLASSEKKYDQAITLFKPILDSKHDAALIPFARYAKGMAELRLSQFDQAAKTLSDLIEQNTSHPLYDDALLSRGIARRNLKDDPGARQDLSLFLDMQPSGTNLGHALYELALLDQNASQTGEAAKKLQRIVDDVPSYPDMDKVIYELGWSLREDGQDEAALDRFNQLIAKYPDNPFVSEAAYFVGQSHYKTQAWDDAVKAFQIAADKSSDIDLKEKALFRLGWSHFKQQQYADAESAFKRQYAEVQQGPLLLDAMLMIGESRFKQNQYETALRAYGKAREKIRADNDSAKTLREPSERQVRELVLLHGGQSAAQLNQFEDAIGWYDELRQRFPATAYLPQVFYEIGFASQNAGDDKKALNFYSQVADNYRNELAARARFMMGEIHFANKAFDQAIPEFQRVMYGFGAENSEPAVQNWQAKSGFEAGRCAELLMQSTQTSAAKLKAKKFAENFYQYVIDKHPGHELAAKAKQRVEALKAS